MSAGFSLLTSNLHTARVIIFIFSLTQAAFLQQTLPNFFVSLINYVPYAPPITSNIRVNKMLVSYKMLGTNYLKICFIYQKLCFSVCFGAYNTWPFLSLN